MKASGWSRSSRQSRGYGAEWERKRKRVLERDLYLCQCSHCKADNRTTAASEVDHVVSKAKAKQLGWSTERTESMNNLQAIASACHRRKTKEEVGATLIPKRRIGLDGFPLEDRGGGV